MKKGYRYNSTAQFQAYQQVQYANFNAAAAAAPNILQRGAQWVGQKVLTPFQMNLRRQAANAGRAASAAKKQAYANAPQATVWGKNVPIKKQADLTEANELFGQAREYADKARNLQRNEQLQRRVGYGVAGAGALGLGGMAIGSALSGNKQQQPMY